MRRIKMSEEQLKKIMDTYIGLINSIENDDVRNGLNSLLEVLGERLMTSPASNKLEYHNCFVGGLVEHSLRVFKNLKILTKSFAPEISNDSIILVSLMHDLGKVGTVDAEYFLPQTSDWHREKGMDYVHNTEIDYMGSAMRSIRLLGEFNVPTTEQEFKAILIHDGQYIPENRPYAHKEGMLALLLHQADVLACRTEQTKWRNIQ
jgi:hypothetical protein